MTTKVGKYMGEIKQNWSKNKYLLWALGLVGVLLFILPGSCSPEQQSETNITSPQQHNFNTQIQRELEQVLAGIEGAGSVQVMLTMEDEQQIIYARNEDVRRSNTWEEDSQGGTREQVEYDESGQLVIVRTNNQEEPVIEKIIKPRVRGVLVVASGAGSPWVRESLIQAIQGVLDLPAYKISVQKGQ